jgi:signal transduction histidine kinase/ActR/RegA family two-component response regulator
MMTKLAKRFSSVRVQLVASVFLWICPALLLTFIVNQSWFWQYAPDWLRQYALSVPWESFFVGLMALIAAWYGGERFILRQVQALTRAVLRLTGGDLKARSGLKEAQGEIGQLATKFDEMVATLQQRQQERDEADRKLLNRAMQQTAVAAVGQCALTNRDLGVIYEQAVYRVAEMFSLEYAMLYRRLPDGSLESVSTYGLQPKELGRTASSSSKPSQMSWTAETGEVTVVNDWRTEERFGMSPLLAEMGVASGVAVAIPTRSKPFGVLAAHTTHRREFSPDDIQFLLAVANIVGMATERINAEAQTEKMASFLTENPNAALEIAADGTLNYFNAAAERLAAELGQAHPQTILPDTLAEIVAESLADGQAKAGVTTKANGRTVSWTFQPLPAFGVVYCYGEDITMRMNLEAQLLQSEKMKTFGQFAAGIAHDFNNMLTIIQGHTSKLLTAPGLPAGSRESLTQVQSAGERAARLTRQLLLTSRKSVMQPRWLDLREIIGSFSQMLQRVLGETIELRFESPDSLPAVYADQSMIEQIIMNLASNARDAMPEGGRLLIEISEATVDPAHLKFHPEAVPGHYVRLRVTDTGDGMDDATRARIFEPFFTTKDIGKGTGLGLATVFNIARQHDGWIEVESEPGRGAVFTVYLPAGKEPASPADMAAMAAQPQTTGGSETILIVEDESMLRELARDILQDCGYRIVEAGSGRQALELWEQHQGRFDLVITDMVMPEGISGMQLAEKLHAHTPRLKVIFMSGYTADEVNADLLQRHRASFIQKPYGHAELTRAVRKCLDKN